jgi:hypothetical protein
VRPSRQHRRSPVAVDEDRAKPLLGRGIEPLELDSDRHRAAALVPSVSADHAAAQVEVPSSGDRRRDLDRCPRARLREVLGDQTAPVRRELDEKRLATAEAQPVGHLVAESVPGRLTLLAPAVERVHQQQTQRARVNRPVDEEIEPRALERRPLGPGASGPHRDPHRALRLSVGSSLVLEAHAEGRGRHEQIVRMLEIFRDVAAGHPLVGRAELVQHGSEVVELTVVDQQDRGFAGHRCGLQTGSAVQRVATERSDPGRLFLRLSCVRNAHA